MEGLLLGLSNRDRMERNVAIVSGGAGSIGTATCRRLASDGYAVILADARPPDEDVAGCVFAELDVRTASSIDRVFELAASHGTLRAVVTAHGILRGAPPGTFDEAIVGSIFDVNLSGVRAHRQGSDRTPGGRRIRRISQQHHGADRTRELVVALSGNEGCRGIAHARICRGPR